MKNIIGWLLEHIVIGILWTAGKLVACMFFLAGQRSGRGVH